MSSIQNLFQQAQLSEAAYANFINSAGNLLTNPNRVAAALQDAGNNMRFSATQATAFVSQWRVVDHIPDTASGFSATLFERLDANGNGTGEFNLAIRGSTFDSGLLDFRVDAGDIFADGVALDQLVDLYNYWQRLSTHSNSTYAAAKLVTLQAETIALIAAYAINPAAGLALEAVLRARADVIIDNPTHTVRTIQFVDSFTLSNVNLRQGLAGALPDELTALSVSGHSLGGHLAMAFTRLFSGANASALAVNGLGFRPTNSNVDRMFRLLGGATGFDATKIYNVFGLEGLEFAAQNTALLKQVGGYQGIFIESAAIFAQALGHRVEQMTDSLALYDLFAKLDSALNTTDPAVGIGKITDILKAASNRPSDTLERVVNSLINFFGLDFAPLAGTLIGNREELYKRAVTLQTVIKGLSANSALTIDVLTTATATDLAILAKGSEALGYRYALKELNPFAILGNNDLYASHNNNGRLNLYDPNTGQGLTQEYLTDRSDMLVNLVARNANDARIVNPGALEATDYIDRRPVVETSGGVTRELIMEDKVLVGGGLVRTGVRKVAFGSDRPDKFEGSGFEDRLYGGGGIDTLVGLGGVDYLQGDAGDDVLVGGVGDDILNGGYGLDTYLWNRGDGRDTIRDDDGKGRLVINGSPVTWAFSTGANTWVSADGKLTLTQNSPLTIHTEDGGEIVVENFRSGDFGIRLLDAPTAPHTVGMILGDKAPVEDSGDAFLFDSNGRAFVVDEHGNVVRPSNSINHRIDPEAVSFRSEFTINGQTYTAAFAIWNDLDSLGNLVVGEEDEPDREDQIFDSPGNDLIRTLGGSDVISAFRGGDDRIEGGAGRDDISDTGGGNDYIEAGANGTDSGDIVFAGNGNDTVFADEAPANFSDGFTAALDPNAQGSGRKGDFLSSGAGDDVVLGGADNDVLMGGSGADALVGGAGDDTLYGDDEDRATTLDWTVSRTNTGTASSPNYVASFTGTVSTAPSGVEGADALYGGAGKDWIFAQGGDDYVEAGSGDDVAFGDGGNDVLIGGEGNDFLDGDSATAVAQGLAGDDYLDGGAGDDALVGEAGDDILYGSIGDDVISGGDGNDILVGGAGNDTLDGGEGDDFYWFRIGDGIDSIQDSGSSGLDVLALREGIDAEMVTLGVGFLQIGVGQDRIQLPGFDPLDPYNTGSIEEILLDDGEVLAYSSLIDGGFDIAGGSSADVLSGTNAIDRISGLDGDDVISSYGGGDVIDGGSGNDTLAGGTGNDTMIGAGGNDTYVFNLGDGVDRVLDNQGNDTIVFGSSITPESVTLDLGSLLIRYGDQGDAIHIEGFNPDDALDSGSIESFQFADGTALTYAELVARGFDLTGTAGDDVIHGTSVNDRIDGGAGNDLLDGGAGSDAYFFGRGDGRDTIQSADTLVGEIDTLRFKPGVAAADIEVTREVDDLVLAISGTQDSIRIANGATHDMVERVEFADETVWDEATLRGMAVTPNQAPVANPDSVTVAEDATTAILVPLLLANDTDPDAGDTRSVTAVDTTGTVGTVAFNAVTQTLTYAADAAAQDALAVGATATDTFNYTIADAAGATSTATVTVTVTGVNDAPVAAPDSVAVNEDATTSNLVPLLLANDTDVDAGDTRSITAVDSTGTLGTVAFDAATQILTYAADAAAQDALGDGATAIDPFTYTLTDAAGASSTATVTVTVTGVNDAPQLVAPFANQFGNQNAAFSFLVSDAAFTDIDAGDALSFGAALANGSVLPTWLNFDPLSRTFSGTPSEFDVGSVDIRVTATDGARASVSDTFALNVSDASTVNETHAGTRRRDVIVTGFANDLIDAGRGDDLVHAGAGRDIVFGGRGEDRLYGEAGNDRLYGGTGEDQLYGGPGYDLLYGGRGGDTLDGGAGTDLLSGGAGHDHLTGGGGENLLIGGAGHDTITGGPGAEVFLVNRDDGQDELHLTGAALEANRDVLSLGGGIGANDISLKRDHGDLIVEARGADERAGVVLKDWYGDAGDHQTVTALQLFEGGTAVTYDFKALVARFDAATQGRSRTERWNAAQALPAVQLTSGAEPLGGDIAREYAMSGTVLGDVPLADEDAEERAARPGGDWDPLPASSEGHPLGSNSKHDSDRGEHHSRGQRESHADLLEAYLGQKPHYDFETLARELERSNRHGKALNAHDIARRWRVVGQFTSALSNEHDEDARGGADYRFNDHGLLGGGAFGGGFGYAGSTGAPRRIATLQTLQGLEEGFQRLHNG